ncbi:NUDIX hydrolase [archaeon]|jgi:isopentenyldiphosphate isomerase|nr:NUDIX hydrolase [archaeon]
MEKIVIVNEKDKIINSKERGTLSGPDIYRVSALWLENEKGEVLLGKRVKTKHKNPGLWGPAVEGTVDSNETYEENIKRETKEELGLENLEIKKLKKQRVTDPYNHFTQWFFAKMDDENFKIQKEEVERIKWFSKEELNSLVKEDSPELIKSLKDFIKNDFN